MRGCLAQSAAHRYELRRLPLAVLLADYSENICIVILMLIYPRQPAALAWLTSGLTIIKICLGAAGLLGVVVSGGKALIRIFNY